MKAAGISHGPSGVKPGAFLLRSQSLPMPGMSLRNTMSRAVRSFAMVYPATCARAASAATRNAGRPITAASSSSQSGWAHQRGRVTSS